MPITRWRDDAGDNLDDIDAERLTAATISFELAWGLVDDETITALRGRGASRDAAAARFGLA